MKTYRIATPDLNVDLTMPSFLFLIFKKFVKVKTSKPEFSGQSLDVVIFDEGALNGPR